MWAIQIQWITSIIGIYLAKFVADTCQLFTYFDYSNLSRQRSSHNHFSYIFNVIFIIISHRSTHWNENIWFVIHIQNQNEMKIILKTYWKGPSDMNCFSTRTTMTTTKTKEISSERYANERERKREKMFITAASFAMLTLQKVENLFYCRIAQLSCTWMHALRMHATYIILSAIKSMQPSILIRFIVLSFWLFFLSQSHFDKQTERWIEREREDLNRGDRYENRMNKHWCWASIKCSPNGRKNVAHEKKDAS